MTFIMFFKISGARFPVEVKEKIVYVCDYTKEQFNFLKFNKPFLTVFVMMITLFLKEPLYL